MSARSMKTYSPAIRTNIGALRAMLNCLRNFRKFRRARILSRACATLINDGTKEQERIGWELRRECLKLWMEIHP